MTHAQKCTVEFFLLARVQWLLKQTVDDKATTESDIVRIARTFILKGDEGLLSK